MVFSVFYFLVALMISFAYSQSLCILRHQHQLPIAPRNRQMAVMAKAHGNTRDNFIRLNIDEKRVYRRLLSRELWKREQLPRKEIKDMFFQADERQLEGSGDLYLCMLMHDFLDEHADDLWKEYANHLPDIYEKYFFEMFVEVIQPDGIYTWLRRMFEFIRYTGEYPELLLKSDRIYNLNVFSRRYQANLNMKEYAQEFIPNCAKVFLGWAASLDRKPELARLSDSMAVVLLSAYRYIYNYYDNRGAIDDFENEMSDLSLETRKLILSMILEMKVHQRRYPLNDLEWNIMVHEVPVENCHERLFWKWPDILADQTVVAPKP